MPAINVSKDPSSSNLVPSTAEAVVPVPAFVRYDRLWISMPPPNPWKPDEREAYGNCLIGQEGVATVVARIGLGHYLHSRRLPKLNTPVLRQVSKVATERSSVPVLLETVLNPFPLYEV